MRYSLYRPVVALAGAILFGCGEAASPSAPADSAAPSFRAEHSIVLNAIYLGGDPSSPLVVGVGFEAGVTPQDVCDGNGGIPEGLGKEVRTPAGGSHSHSSGKDMHIDVFAFGEGSGDPCAFAQAPLVGTGTGKFAVNFQDSGPGALVIHATVQGIVDLVAGGQARVFATARVTVLPDDTLLFDDEVVRLTPL
jgi:hypothetical protein